MKKAKGKNNQRIIFLLFAGNNYRAHRFRLCRLMCGKASPFR
jgi:hypothetical protein